MLRRVSPARISYTKQPGGEGHGARVAERRPVHVRRGGGGGGAAAGRPEPPVATQRLRGSTASTGGPRRSSSSTARRNGQVDGSGDRCSASMRSGRAGSPA